MRRGLSALLPDAALATLLLTVTFWGVNVSIVKWALGEWQPLAYSFDRFVVGALVFAAWVVAREGSLRVERRDLPLLALAGVVGIAGNQICFMYATRYAPAANVSLLMAAAPAFAALAAWALGQERVTGRHWFGLLVAAAGVALVLHGSGARLDLSAVRGDVLALGMAATWATYSVLIRPLMARYSPARISAIVAVIGTPLLLPFAWGQVLSQDYGQLSTRAWGAIVYSLLFSFVITNVLWFRAVHRGGASRATAVLTLQPFIGALAALALLDERVTVEMWAGGLVIVGGIALTRRRARIVAPDG
jgi:drug/metabolite transporter (DMT)-like permease